MKRVYETTVYVGEGKGAYGDAYRTFRFASHDDARRFASGKVGVGGQPATVIAAEVHKSLIARWRREGQIS